MSSWEYCAVAGFKVAGWGIDTTSPKVYYFTGNGAKTVEIKGGSPTAEGNRVAQIIAELGDQGWEMVGNTDYPTEAGVFTTVYFKRAKS